MTRQPNIERPLSKRERIKQLKTFRADLQKALELIYEANSIIEDYQFEDDSDLSFDAISDCDIDAIEQERARLNKLIKSEQKRHAK